MSSIMVLVTSYTWFHLTKQQITMSPPIHTIPVTRCFEGTTLSYTQRYFGESSTNHALFLFSEAESSHLLSLIKYTTIAFVHYKQEKKEKVTLKACRKGCLARRHHLWKQGWWRHFWCIVISRETRGSQGLFVKGAWGWLVSLFTPRPYVLTRQDATLQTASKTFRCAVNAFPVLPCWWVSLRFSTKGSIKRENKKKKPKGTLLHKLREKSIQNKKMEAIINKTEDGMEERETTKVDFLLKSWRYFRRLKVWVTTVN